MGLILFNIFIFEILLKQKKNKEFVVIILIFLILMLNCYEGNIFYYYFIIRFIDLVLMYFFRFFFIKLYFEFLPINVYYFFSFRFKHTVNSFFEQKLGFNLISLNCDETIVMFLFKLLCFYFNFWFFLLVLIFDNLKRMNFRLDYDFAIRGYLYCHASDMLYKYPIFLTKQGLNKTKVYREFLLELKYNHFDDLYLAEGDEDHENEDMFYQDPMSEYD